MDELLDGKYRVEKLIGEGGMGKVFAAVHVEIGRRCAIKVLKAEAAASSEVSARFTREARAAGHLTSEHVCRVTDVGVTATNEPFMVMELLDGCDLATDLRRRAPSVGLAATYIRQACAGLAEAHALGMVHRDVKPANMFLVASDAGPLVKILDFGIATASVLDSDHSLTHTQSVMGSPVYMSPEQVRSAKHVDPRSDIWSLGVSLYELASGKLPFIAPSLGALAVMIATEPHPPLVDAPDGFAELVDRCLRKDPAERFASVTELADALAPFCTATGAARTTAAAASDPRGVESTLHGGAVAALPSVRAAPPERVEDVALPRRGLLPLVFGAVFAVAAIVVIVVVAIDPGAKPKPPPDEREQLAALFAQKDPYGAAAGLRVMQHQVTAAEYDWYLKILEREPARHAAAMPRGEAGSARASVDPVIGLDSAQAAAFCGAIKARLMTEDEWRALAGDGWGIARAGAPGPVAEWVTPRKGDQVETCGGHRGMTADEEQRLRAIKWCTVVGRANEAMLVGNVGFRCVVDR